VKVYDEIFYAKADPRIRDKFLMGDPAPVLIIFTTIFVLLKVCLKKIMESRQPIRLNNLEHVMNYVYAACSIYVFVKCCKLWMFHYSWKCEKVDSTDSPLDLEVRKIIFFVFINLNFFFFRQSTYAISTSCQNFYSFSRMSFYA